MLSYHMVSRLKIKTLKSLEYISDIADIHMKTFTGFFLTFLGKGFLKQLYKGFITHDESNIIGAFEDGKIIGFLAYSENPSGFYKYLIRKSLIPFAFYSFIALIKKPEIILRLLRAFTYSKSSKCDEAYIEISSIGVLPAAKNKGVGSMLIKKLKDSANNGRYCYIKLETDKENNDSVNMFYMKNGFVLNRSYMTHEGRQMNEYRYYLKSGELGSVI